MERDTHGKRRVLAGIAIELVLAGAALCVFAFFHHVLPRLRLESAPPQAIADTVDATEGDGAEYNGTADEALSWREKFSGKFTEEIWISDTEYRSPDISISLSRHSFTEEFPRMTYYVADIYLAEPESFQTCFPLKGSSGPAEQVAGDSGAILAMNGDYCMNQSSGFLVRNGQLYMEEQTTCDICVLYMDGSMETYSPEEYTVAEELEKEPWQVWKFGPELLEEDGSPKSEFNTTAPLLAIHPRAGLGYYEPGHYCFVVVDGRQSGYSDGASMETFASIFSELGCKSAYNLDGGASACLVFNGQTVNTPCGGGREVGDMLIIKETGEAGK